MRRRKTGRHQSSQARASFPMARPHISESKAALRLEQRLNELPVSVNGDVSSDERTHTEGKMLSDTLLW